MRIQRLLEPLDLRLERLGLLNVALGLKPAERVELGDVADVVLLEQPGDGVLCGHAALDQAQPGPEHIAKRPQLVGDHVRLGQEIGAQKMG